MRNVLVTGANGFIGQFLCKRMLTEGYRVRGAVRGQEKTEVGGQRSEVRSQRSDVRGQEKTEVGGRKGRC